MPTFLFVRHGENEYVKEGRLAGRLPGVHLNDNGRKQAQAVAKSLVGMKISAVYSSPLERTMETAQPIAEALHTQVIPRAGLNEVDFGEWQGKTLKSLRRRKLWKIVQAAPSQMRFPGGESFSEAQIRICQEIENLSETHNPKDLLVCVSHSDIIKLAVAYYVGIPIDLFQRVLISPGSMTVLSINRGRSHLITLNNCLSNPLPEI